MAMNEDVKKQILDTVKAYDRIILTRHARPDGDAVGAALGLYEILRLSFPEKTVLLSNADKAESVAFLGDPASLADEAAFDGALAIVLDTGTFDRLSDTRLDRARGIVKIDHHIDDKPFGDLSWIEQEASSTCEMIVDFYLSFREELKINTYAATCLYTGMVTDSGRFRFHGTTGDTHRRAAALLDLGVDTDSVFSHLYVDRPSMIAYHAYVLRHMKYTENGVAWVVIPDRVRRRFGLNSEEVGNCVTFLDGIRGSYIWFAVIENGDGTWRVRLRSRFADIQPLATRYHGGGHACASGATLHNRAERKRFLKDADALLAECKSAHPDWI